MSLKVKVDQIYRAKATDRLWMFDGEVVLTKGRLDHIWKLAVWPQPQMEVKDIEYYLNTGDFEEY